MRKDCKKEAKDFDNGVHELAYTLGQVHHLADIAAYKASRI